MTDPVLAVQALGPPPWPTLDPFLFLAHHHDAYPAGNDALGPRASLAGRELGMDFAGKDGWRMYHGREVPGFPAHPHRGFETVTLVTSGLVDHSDSLGATARFGEGDVQWLTAGRGIVHAEMFPLVHADRDNPLELFQIWLNLPASDKMADPHFSMLWGPTLPRFAAGEPGHRAEVLVVAGAFGEHRPPAPPPRSWASRPEADVAIWALRLDPGARLALPPGGSGTHRVLYVHAGTAEVADRAVGAPTAVQVRPDAEVAVAGGAEGARVLVLQGRPIGEPVAAHGPFVMNHRVELAQAFADYQRTQFGGWPFGSEAPVHRREEGRFARRPDGSEERPAG